MNTQTQKSESVNEIPIKLASKSRRATAFLLDLLLAFAIIMMVIRAIIIPRIHPGAIEEMDGILIKYSETKQMSQAELIESLSPELKEAVQASQATTLFGIWLYFTISEVLMAGRSLGKKVFSLRVISQRTMQAPRLMESFLRSGLKTMALIAFFPVFIFNYFIVFLNKSNQAGHDILSRTLVIEDA